MFDYLKNSIKRKIARRVTKEYPVRLDAFPLPGYGVVRFANWENPLVEAKQLREDQLAFFRRFLHPGDMAVDIGANIGHVSVLMSLLCGPEGLVLSFDPNPYVFRILEKNCSLNPSLGRILPFNNAITDQDEEFYYHSSEASFNNGGISKEPSSEHGTHTLPRKIRGIRLENFLAERFPDNLPALNLIKIDTEGYDREIIRSISGLLEKRHPAVITECFGKNTAEARFEQFDLLKSKGYDLHYFSDFSVSAEVIPIRKKEEMLNWKHFDLFAV